jgi:thiol-disulfide isomerase/thioredoxin
MKFHKFLLFSIVALTLAMSACAPAKADDVMMDKPTETMMEKPTEAMLDKPTETMMAHETPTPDAMLAKPTEGALIAAPAWFGVTLTNVSAGETFTINDFKGKVVLVETMAQWCSNCKQQQKQVKSLHEKLGMPADLVTIALDIDPNENGDTLKTYAANNGFDWIYTIAPADISREIGNLYGDQFLNPPSTPMLIIDRHGDAHLLPFGIKSADDLQKALEPYLSGM